MLRRILLVCSALSACYSSTDVPFDGDPRQSGGGAITGDVAPVVDGGTPTAASPDAALPPPVAVITSPLTYYKDVKPIIDAKCTQCHVQGGMGHFPFTKYDELKPLAGVIKADVVSEKMPPWRATGPLDKYVGDRRLTPAQKSIIASWVDQGAPAGDPSEAAPSVPPVKRGLPRVDSELSIPAGYTPQQDPDTYRCFVLDWPHQQTKFITGLSIEPDSTEMVHHAIVYLVNPQNVATIRQREAADPEPGYDCFSGAGTTTQWLTSYEPGGYGQENPGGLGFQVAPGSVLVLQMHYNTLRGKKPDQSKVQLMLADQVERVGTVSLIMNNLWAVGFMGIAANQPDVVHSWTGRPLGLSRDLTYEIFWADLHAHTLASQMYMGIVRAGQTVREPLLEIPDWAFEWQETFRLREPVRLNPGDQLYVECHFDNTEPNQFVLEGQRLPVRNVNWGEGTTDEMCLGNVLLTPVK
jgi:hypothetical protein